MTVILETAAYTAHKQEKLTLSEKTQKTTDQKGQIRSLYRHVYSKYINTEPVLSFGVMCTKKWNVSYEDYTHALNQRYMSWPFKSVCVSRCVLWEKVHRSFINLLSSPHSYQGRKTVWSHADSSWGYYPYSLFLRTQPFIYTHIKSNGKRPIIFNDRETNISRLPLWKLQSITLT